MPFKSPCMLTHTFSLKFSAGKDKALQCIPLLCVPLDPVSWQHPGTLASLLHRFAAAPRRVAFLPPAAPIPATNDSHSAQPEAQSNVL